MSFSRLRIEVNVLIGKSSFSSIIIIATKITRSIRLIKRNLRFNLKD